MTLCPRNMLFGLSAAHITEINRVQLVLFGIQNRTPIPYLAAHIGS
jgi:hypothetical protein